MVGYPDTNDLEVTVDAGFGADTTGDPASWTWTDLTSRLVAAPITVNRGVLVGAGSHRSASSSITLLNDDGALTPLLATSPYWPYVDVGTPMRVRVRSTTTPWISDTFTRTAGSGWGVADSGQTWTADTYTSTNGSAGVFSVPSTNFLINSRIARTHRDVWVKWDCSIAAVSTGAAQIVGPMMRGQSNGAFTDQVLAGLEFQPGGTLQWAVRTILGGGFFLVTRDAESFTYTAGMAVRCEVELIDDMIRARAWPASGSPPPDWTFQVQLEDLIGGTVGHYLGMTNWVYSGVTNTLPNPVSVDNLTFSQPRYPRIDGYITDVQPTFQPLPDGSVHSVVRIDVGGIGSRLERREAAALSPMRRSLQESVSPPRVYWPCEDPQGAVSAASAFPGGTPMIATGPAVFDFDTGETDDYKLRTYGTLHVCSVAAGASLSGGANPTVGSSAWTVSAMVDQYTPGVGGGVTEVRWLEWTTPGGTHTRWALVRTLTGHTVRAYNDNNTGGGYLDVCTYTNNVGGMVGLDVSAAQSGSSVTVTIWLNATSVATGSVTSALAGVTRVKVNPDRVNTTASTDPYGIRFRVAHVMVHDTALTAAFPYYYDGSVLLEAARAWVDEYAHRRFSRLCTEERVPWKVAGNPYDTGGTEVGVQQPGSFSELLAASIEAESGGLIVEDGFGYTHVPRTARYNQPARLVVDMSTYRYSGGDGTDVLVPKLDARGPNYWTIKRTGGSEASAAAPLSYRNRRGTIADSATLDVLSDADCAQHATWRVHLNADGTQPNYPQLTLDLAANPGLIDDYLALTIGSRVQRTNQPTIAGRDTIDQVVDQMSETFTPRSAGGPSWVAQLDCSPAGVWDVAVFDVSRYDSASTTLASPVSTTTSTSFAVKTVSPLDVWDTTAVPYDWLVDGEQVTVTAVTAAVLSGGTYNQTATVVRAVNGVARTHVAGAEVHLANPAYMAL